MDTWGIITAAGVAFVVTALLGRVLIPFLRRLKYGQTILDIGPRWHKQKEGTPTMGGLMFIIGISIAALTGFFLISMSEGEMFSAERSLVNVRFFAGLGLALAFAFVGFMDDYISVAKKRNLGLTVKEKLVIQLVISIAYLATLYISGDRSTIVIIPFIGQLDFGIFYYPFAVFVIIAMVNAVNITDGVDGLCPSVTLIVAAGFVAVSGLMGLVQQSILAAALAGGMLGFLVWNFYPAKVFMGDTGSFFLGGLVSALGFGVSLPMILLLIGIVYVLENLSVVLQVISFKTTGKRIFKMSPIHHHFEMSGWSEIKIVTVFSFVSLIGALITIMYITSLYK